MNATTRFMKSRLPRKNILCPADIASAMGLATANAVLQAIKDGRIAAARNILNGRFSIAREEAERFIDSTAYSPEEGTL